MSNQIENRIVEMEFDNKQFEDGVKESLSTLDKLKKALNFKDAGKNLEQFSKATKTFDLNGIGSAIEKVGEKFSTFRILGIHALTNVVDFAMEAGQKIGKALMGPLDQIKTGGWNRAMNIEQAKFQLEGLGVAWEEISEDIDYGVSQTAYGLDAAAKAAAQLTASGVEFGATFGDKGNSPMAHALRGISGVAAMTNSTYEDISNIFTKIAGQGRVYAQDLNSLAARGLNAAAVLAEQFHISEEELRELVHDGQIDFEIFSDAMYEAFGEHAVEANNTFTGALSNIRAALSRTGQPFATSIIHGMIPIFNEIRLFVNALNSKLGGVAEVFENITSLLSDFASFKISSITSEFSERFTGLTNIGNAFANVFEAVLRIIGAISQAFSVVFPSNGGFIDFLNNAAIAAERFSEKLILDDDALDRLRNTIIVILTVLKGLFIVLGSILKVVGSLVGFVFKLLGGLGNVVIFLGNLVYTGASLVATFVKGLNIGEKLSIIFEKIGEFAIYLKDSLSDASTVLGKFVQGLKYVGIAIGGILAGPFALIYFGIDYLSNAIANATNPIDFLKSQFTLLGDKVKEFIAYLKQLPVVGKAVKAVSAIFEKVQKAIGNVKKFFQDLIDKIKDGNGVIDILRDKLGRLKVSTLTSKLTGLAAVFDKVKTAALSLGTVIIGAVVKAFLEIKNLIDGMMNSKDPFSFFKKKVEELNTKFWEFIDNLRELPVVGDAIKNIEAAFNAVKEVIVSIVGWFEDFYNQVKEGASFFEVLKTKVTELGEAFKTGLQERIDDFLKDKEGLRATLNDIKVWLNGAKESIITFANVVKDKFKELTPAKIALAALAAFILVLAFNVNELILAFGSLARKLSGGFANMFRVLPTKYDKFITGLIAISSAVVLIAGAFYLLKDVETDKLKEITKSIAILVGLVGGLALISTLIVEICTRWSLGKDSFMAFAANMLALSAGVVILIGALKLLEQVNFDGIWYRVGVLGAILGALLIAGILMGRLAPKLTVGGLFLIAFAGAVYVLVLALDRLSTVDLSGLKTNWKELAAVIIAFGVFAAAANSVGIGTVIGLIAFLVALRILFKNFDAIKAELERNKIGELLYKFAARLKAEIVKAVVNLKNAYQSLSEFDKIMLAIYAIITTGSIVALTAVMSSASRSIRRAVISIGLLLAGIAAFLAIFYAIADIARDIPLESIKQAEKILQEVGLFIIILLSVCAIGSGGTLNRAAGVRGSTGAWMAAQGVLNWNTMEHNILQIRKLLVSMAALLVAIAAFMFVVGQLTPEQMKQGEKLLIGVMGFISVLSIACSFITRSAILSGGFTVGFSTFVGIAGLMGVLIAAFVGLMYYFENFDFAHRWKELVAAIIGLGAVVASVSVFCRMVTKYSGGLGLSAVIGSIGVSVALIGGVIILMTKYIKPDQVKHAITMALILGAFLGGLSALAIIIAKSSTKIKKLEKVFAKNSLLSLGFILGEIITLLVILGGLAIAFQKLNIKTSTMIIQLGSLVTFVTMLIGLVIAIMTVCKKVSSGEETQLIAAHAKIITITQLIMGLIAAVIIFAGIAYALRKVNALNMAAQFALLTAMLYALIVFAKELPAMGTFIGADNMINGAKFEMLIAGLIVLVGMLSGLAILLEKTGVSLATIGKLALMELLLAGLAALQWAIGKLASQMSMAAPGVGVLTWMIGLLYTMAPLLYFLENYVHGDKAYEGVASLIGFLVLLGGVAAACIALGTNSAMIVSGVGILTWMLGLLMTLAPIFKLIDGLTKDVNTVLKGCFGLIGVLVALGGVAAMCIALGHFASKSAAGIGILTWMLGLFMTLAPIFVLLDRLKSPAGRILGIASSISLVLAELGAIAAMCIAVGYFAAQSAMGVAMLSWMLGLFQALVPVFVIIDNMKTKADRILGISQSIVLVLVELGGIAAACIALGYFSFLIVPGITTLYLMLPLLYALMPIFMIIDNMKTKASRILGVSQIIMLVLVELTVIASTLGALIIAVVLGSISATALVPLLLIFGVLTLIFDVIQHIKVEGLLNKSQIIMLALVELVAIASLMGALIIALVLGSVSAAGLLPLVYVFGILTDIFVIISRIRPNGLLKKSQIIMLALVELVAIASLMGALIIAIVLGGVSAVALLPLVYVFGTLVEIFKEIQKIDVFDIDKKANAVMLCLLKLVGIASVMGILTPLVALSVLGIPGILALCSGMVLVAGALKTLENANPEKIEKIAEIITDVIYDVVKAGALGAIGGPGLIMIASALAILGEACALAGPGIKAFADALTTLANITPDKVNMMSMAISQFFKQIARGFADLGTGLGVMVTRISKGIVVAINQFKKSEEGFNFLFKMLRKFIKICADAGSSVLQVLAISKSLEFLGAAIGMAAYGIGALADGVSKLSKITPAEIENMKKALEVFFIGVAKGITDMSKAVAEGCLVMASGIIELNNVLTNSNEVLDIVYNAYWMLILLLATLGAMAVPLYVFSQAMIRASAAIAILAFAFKTLSKMSDGEIEQAKKAIMAFLDGLGESSKNLVELNKVLLGIVGIIALFGLAVTVFGPGLAGVAAMIVAVTMAITMLMVVLTGLIYLVDQIVARADEVTQHIQTIVLGTAQAIADGITEIGQSIVVQIISIGMAISAAIDQIILGVIGSIITGGGMITGAVGEILGTITTAINGKVMEAKTWGSDLVDSFASGIRGGLDGVRKAVTEVANIVHRILHFSHPDEGPLVDFETYAPDMMNLYNSQIVDGQAGTQAATTGVAEIIKNTIGGGSDLATNVGNNAKGIIGNLLSNLSAQIPQLEGVTSYINSLLSFGGSVQLPSKEIADQRRQLINDRDKYQKEYKKARINELAGIHKVGGKEVGNMYAKQAEAYMTAIKGVDEEMAKLDGTAKTNTKTIEEWGQAMENAGKGAGGAKEEMSDFTSELTNVLEGQMNIFSKFEEKEAISKETLLENMRSQIEGMTKWANNMNALAAKGIDQGLYEKLAMMGPEGAQYVAAFNEMTAEELAQANTLWGQSLILPTAVSRSISASFAGLGTGVVMGFVNGMDKDSSIATDYIANFGADLWQAFHDSKLQFGSPSIAMEMFGMNLMIGLKDGIRGYARLPIDAMLGVCVNINNEARKGLAPEKFVSIGIGVIDGLTAGLQDSGALGRLLDAVYAIANAILAAMNGGNGLDINSPSKKTRESGHSIVEGLILGMRDKTNEAIIASEDLANDVLQPMRDTIAGVAKNLLEDDEFTPVITPVLDLTNVSEGAKRLNGILATNQTLHNVSALANLQNEQFNPDNPNSRFGTTFIQNNYSPKALNRIEIYRQTKNQFAQYKEAMQ